MTYNQFFKGSTGNDPYDYQSRLAGGDQGTTCRSKLINIPTGLGKTAAVVLAWIWNRVYLQSENWPRRLVYCLPMRTLVEQTQENVSYWLRQLQKADTEKGKAAEDLDWLAKHSPVILMGGEELSDRHREWDIYPEKPAILIGTQDMLLSRALNRGYGMSRYRWPMHFGLLNNDCLWVMDETQLMGVGVETSAQLDGFRHDGKMPTFGACSTWWMSATLAGERLATVDHPAPSDGWPRVELSKDEKEKPGSRPKALFEARKAVFRSEIVLSSATKADYAGELAEIIRQKHQEGTLTLVVVNRVDRAREIYKALTRVEKKSKNALYDPARVALIHSRFRPNDRAEHENLLFGAGDRIVIATQAVEAGIDVSARLLITELAPWSSLVQRIGRCNRHAKLEGAQVWRAEFSDAEVLWVDIEPDAKGDLVLPYSEDDLHKARQALTEPVLTDASPRSLSRINVPEAPVVRAVIRRRDLLDLFDTTPDICGQDLDISRYIRDADDTDVQFFWREVGADRPALEEKPPRREELCRVSIGSAAKFFEKKPRAWRWNPLIEEWEEARKPRPGAVYLLDVEAGGYGERFGWTGDPKDKPKPCPPLEGQHESYGGNKSSFAYREWQTLAVHTDLVVKEIEAVLDELSLEGTISKVLCTAALWHDIGKAHKCFQAMLRLEGDSPPDPNEVYAKSKNPHSIRHDDETRWGFRHELASALAWILNAPSNSADHDLVAYLIAAHHGKVRLSIRSLPDEKGDPNDPERLFARGIWDGENLPAIQLKALSIPESTLDLSFMKMGEGPRGPSWLARTIALRDRNDLGPFRLAFLETLLRAADGRASASPKTDYQGNRHA